VDVAFDPAAPEWATAEVASRVDGAATVAVAIPRSPITRLGIAQDLLGSASGASTQIEARLDVVSLSTGHTEVRGVLAIFDLRGAHGTVDVKLDLAASGDADPVPVTGGLTVGAIHGRLGGNLWRAGAGTRAELAWKPSGIPCGDGSAEPHARSRMPQPASPAVVFAVDLRDLGATEARPSPAPCFFGILEAP
jgi:hypothetical protein